MRKRLGALAVLATCAVVGITATVALAALGPTYLHNPQKASGCGTQAGGVWHFVHNQTSAPNGVITVDFVDGGHPPFNVPDSPSPSVNLHYYVTNVNGGAMDTVPPVFDTTNPAQGKLVLSDCPPLPPPP